MAEFSSKRGGGGPTTYSGAICKQNLQRGGGGGGGGGEDPLDTPPGSVPDSWHSCESLFADCIHFRISYDVYWYQLYLARGLQLHE